MKSWTAEDLHALREGTTVVLTRPAVFRIEGPGAAECLQGVLTNDVQGGAGVVFGAMLTPKGMIEVDLWSFRDRTGFTLLAPAAGRETAAGLFRRQLPPRLARVTDRTDEWSAVWLLGGRSQAAVREAGLPWPEHAQVGDPTDALRTAVLPDSAPARWVAVGADGPVREVAARLREAGAREGGEDHLHLARILAGWPALGYEISAKTLPQEVRFEELGGVSYSKGCYVGQETVARVHFRGHPNRQLRGLTWEGPAGAMAGTPVVRDAREVGTVTTAAEVSGRAAALAVIRREVTPGDEVQVGAHVARVIELPFPAEWPANA